MEQVTDPAYRSLVDSPSPATLTLLGESGQAITSPVWFRLSGSSFEVVVAVGDRKLADLQRNSDCVLLVFESVHPFRGIRVRDRATLTPDEGSEVRRAIASRYLGREKGEMYAELSRRRPGFVVRLSAATAYFWDLADKLP